jgi:hypothetical protein
MTNKRPATVTVERETVSCRLLDSRLTDDDKFYLVRMLVESGYATYKFWNEDRVRKILRLEPEDPPTKC